MEMTEDIRRLLYTTKDGRWYWETDYAVDQLELDVEDIDFERIPKIRELLIANARNEELRVPLEAALVLAAWGDEAGLEYLEYIVDLDYEDRARAGYIYEPRRYDSTLEWVTRAVIWFWLTRQNIDGCDSQRERIFSIMMKILHKSSSEHFEFVFLNWILRQDYREYDEGLRNYLNATLENRDKYSYKLPALLEFYTKYDPEYLQDAPYKFGFDPSAYKGIFRR